MENTIRKIQSANDHPNTGPIKFGRNWPGVFIRGDEALGLAHRIEIGQRLETLPVDDGLLKEIVTLLKSCMVSERG